jgi:hypothetical protein
MLTMLDGATLETITNSLGFIFSDGNYPDING